MAEAEMAAALTPGEIDAKIHKLTTRCAWGSAGLGLVPVPLVDVVAIGGLQVWLVREIANLRGVPFSGNRVKALISALIGGGVPTVLAGGMASVVKLVPFVGPLLTIGVMPGMLAAATLAIGRVFNAHFKAGGTLLDFDAAKMRAFYEEELAKAKAEVKAKAAAATA